MTLSAGTVRSRASIWFLSKYKSGFFLRMLAGSWSVSSDLERRAGVANLNYADTKGSGKVLSFAVTWRVDFLTSRKDFLLIKKWFTRDYEMLKFHFELREVRKPSFTFRNISRAIVTMHTLMLFSSLLPWKVGAEQILPCHPNPQVLIRTNIPNSDPDFDFDRKTV